MTLRHRLAKQLACDASAVGSWALLECVSPMKRPLYRLTPWSRLDEYRREYESLIDRLIARARRDPHFEDRTDVLSLFLRSTYDDGSAMTRAEIGDELLTLLGAGHETTASNLAWAFERITRHPDVLEKLVAEGAAEIAFAMHATAITDLVEVSDAGELMPPKSTWFEPKLISGLLVHRF